jgi:type I restriction enzyme M protein
VSYDDIEAKNYSFSAGQYFDVKVGHVKTTHVQFERDLAAYQEKLKGLFDESRSRENEISKQIKALRYE